MRKPYTSYNPYFFIPFLIWCTVGGVLITIYDKEASFGWVNSHHSSVLDVIMLKGTMIGEGVIIALILLLLMSLKMYRNWWYFTTALACGILPSIITQIIKRRVAAPRPINFFANADWINKVPGMEELMHNSFPSGHTTGAFSLMSFLAVLLMPKYRHWGTILFLIALFVAYTRMYLAVHFLEDIYAGSIIGTVFTVIVIAFMNRFNGFFLRNK